MTGMITVLFLWIIWTYATFIIKKEASERMWLAAFSLVILIMMPITVKMYGFYITGPSILILLTSYKLAVKQVMKTQLYLLFTVITFMLGYAGLLLIEMFDPIWVVLDRRLIFGVLFFVFCYIAFPKSILLRIIAICLGALQGEVLFASILYNRGMPYVIGSFDTLDIITICCLLNGINYIVNEFSLTISQRNNKYT